MSDNLERRTLTAPVELREAQTGTKVITGYAAVFSSETNVAGVFRERIAPGAFAKSIAADDIRALFNHESCNVLGRTKPGTLRLTEDERGLNYEIDPPDTQLARDLALSMARGDIDGSSFAFRAIREEWDDSGELPLRTILEAKLTEVSIVTFPQYEDAEAEIAMRSLDAARKEQRAAVNRSGYARRKAETEHKFRRFPAQPEA